MQYKKHCSFSLFNYTTEIQTDFLTIFLKINFMHWRYVRNCGHLWPFNQLYWNCVCIRTIKGSRAQPSQRQATKNVCKTRDCNTIFELLMMSGVSPKTCWAIKKHWNNKFNYTVASCWFFLWVLYYDARIHGHQERQEIMGSFLVFGFIRCCETIFLCEGEDR
jgi:hypothetical protein